MENLNVVLTPIDQLILNSYITTMEGLADYLGEGYELVLHSLEDLDHSVIKIINGHHTGRKEGAPITDLALNMLSAMEEQNNGDFISYSTKNRFGVPLRATTIRVRGEHGRIIALLCINFYMDTPLTTLLASWGLNESDGGKSVNEYFAENPTELVNKSVANAILQVDSDPTTSPSVRNKRIICLLHDWGVFKLKNSVESVADQLMISSGTVYMHLRNYDKVK